MSDRPPSSSSARYISDKHTCIDVGAQDRTYVIKSWEIEVHLSNDSDAELTNSNKGTHFQKCVLKCQCALLNGSGKHATLFASQERGDQKYIIRCSQPPLKPATNQPSLQPMLVRHRHGHPHALWAHLTPHSFSSSSSSQSHYSSLHRTNSAGEHHAPTALSALQNPQTNVTHFPTAL
jgi:hypothetical protein